MPAVKNHPKNIGSTLFLTFSSKKGTASTTIGTDPAPVKIWAKRKTI